MIIQEGEMKQCVILIPLHATTSMKEAQKRRTSYAVGGAEKANKSWETREKRIEDLFLLLSLFRFSEAVGPSFSLS